MATPHCLFIHVSVRSLQGKQVEYTVDSEDTTVLAFKNIVGNDFDIPPHRVVLVFPGKRLDNDDAMLSEYGITDGQLLHCMPKKGGARIKRKLTISFLIIAICYSFCEIVFSGRHGTPAAYYCQIRSERIPLQALFDGNKNLSVEGRNCKRCVQRPRGI